MNLRTVISMYRDPSWVPEDIENSWSFRQVKAREGILLIDFNPRTQVLVLHGADIDPKDEKHEGVLSFSVARIKGGENG